MNLESLWARHLKRRRTALAEALQQAERDAAVRRLLDQASGPVSPEHLTMEQVRDVVEHDATPPAGIDPATVDACRRIVRLLGG
jgi:hypothetical protein